MSTDNPWTTISSRTVYANDWIRVREDQVVRPDGNPGIYGVIESSTAAGVVALGAENEVVLVGQYRYPTQEYSWEIIEGGAKATESPLEAAKRELHEEAGLRAKQWTPLGHELHLSNCISAERGFLFVARELSAIEACPDATEILRVKRVPFAEALHMVHSGMIKDTLSVIGILLADRHLRLGQANS